MTTTRIAHIANLAYDAMLADDPNGFDDIATWDRYDVAMLVADNRDMFAGADDDDLAECRFTDDYINATVDLIMERHAS